MITEDSDGAVPAQRAAGPHQRSKPPTGLPPREQLSPEELGLLREFELAEKALDELRRNEWA